MCETNNFAIIIFITTWDTDLFLLCKVSYDEYEWGVIIGWLEMNVNLLLLFKAN